MSETPASKIARLAAAYFAGPSAMLRGYGATGDAYEARWRRTTLLQTLNDELGFEGYSGTLDAGVYEFYLPGRWSALADDKTPYSVRLRLPQCEVWVATRAPQLAFRGDRYQRTYDTHPPLTPEQADDYAVRLQRAALLLA